MNRPRGCGVVVATALLGGVCGGPAVQAQPCEPGWSSPFGWNGVSAVTPAENVDGVFAATVEEDVAPGSRRSIYIGGYFGIAGGVDANCAAKWDGAGGWSRLSSGWNDVGHEVRAMAIFDPGDGSGPGVYAGGTFANMLMRSNGVQWQGVTGLGGPHIQALLVGEDGAALYIARSTRNTVSPDNGVYRWDGQTKTQMGRGQPGLPVEVDCLAFLDEDGPGPMPLSLYVGGLAGVGGSAVARWDGTFWIPMGIGEGGRVHALEILDPDGDGPGLPRLYAGGLFTAEHGAPTDNLVHWDGAEWQPVETGASGRVRALRSFDLGDGAGSALYIGGDFETVGGVASRGIARYDGETFSALGGGVGGGNTYWGIVQAIVPYDDGLGGPPMLLVMGRFGSAGPIRSYGLAWWTGSGWRAAGSGPPLVRNSGAAAANGPAQTPLAVTGTPSDGPSTHQMLALWDGAKWDVAGGRIEGAVNILKWLDLDDGRGLTLFAGGQFRTVDGEPVGGVARFDDGAWVPLGGGVDAAEGTVVEVDALATWREPSTGRMLLVVGGAFDTAGGQPASNIAAWDGAGWSPLGPGLSGRVQALTTMEGPSGTWLYAGGEFVNAGELTVNRVARWDGEGWSALGEGLSGSGFPLTEVNTLAVDDRARPHPTLLAGGNFSVDSSFGGVARWDGTQWHVFRKPDLTPFSLISYDPDGTGPQLPVMFVLGGRGPGELVRLQRWNGTIWQGTGINLHNGRNLPSLRTLTALEPLSYGSGFLVDGAFTTFRTGLRALGLALYGGCPRCPVDYNNDGVANSGDISSFLEGWLSAVSGGAVDADFNRDHAVNSGDISAFLTEWLAAVTGGC